MFNNSVASITASLTKMVSKLQKHEKDMSDRVDTLSAELERLFNEQVDALEERRRAAQIAAKITALIE